MQTISTMKTQERVPISTFFVFAKGKEERWILRNRGWFQIVKALPSSPFKERFPALGLRKARDKTECWKAGAQ